MRIEHLAVWTLDLEKTKDFYVRYFGMKCNKKYTNTTKKFSSYFLSFDGASTRIELMHRPDISDFSGYHGSSFGLTHFAISVGSKEEVDLLTERLRSDGYRIVGEPRTTGDGYHESVVEDCEGNLVEVTA
jgi:lactoylglutathione lyase